MVDSLLARLTSRSVMGMGCDRAELVDGKVRCPVGSSLQDSLAATRQC